MIYRKATKQDIPQLCQIRKQQLIDEGIPPSIDIDKDLLRFFQDSFQHDTIIEFLAIDNDQIIATGAVCFYDYPPTFSNQTGRIAYITNMYTKPAYRRQSIATHMLDLLINEIKKKHIEIVRLGASQLGKPVYEKYGFQQDNQWYSLRLDN